MNALRACKYLMVFTWLGLCSAPACAHADKVSTHTLNLKEVLQSVDCHFPQIKIARLEIVRASGGLVHAKGRFDPTVDAFTQSQPVGGYVNNYGDMQLTVPTLYNGLKLFAGYRNGAGDWPSYYQNYLTNSGGEYRVGLSLPLLRDRKIDKERTELLTNAQSVLMKQQDAEAVKIRIYQEAIKAYWQWVEAGLQLQIFEELLNLAETRQRAIVKRANQGDLARLAISENKQQIVQREQLINQGRMFLEQAGVNLSLYFRDEKGHPVIPKKYALPSLAAASAPFQDPQVAIWDHPDIKKLNNFTTIMQLKRDQARNEMLPQLDANALTLKQNGTGGDPLWLPQTVMAGVTFKFPLFQRQARGNLIRAQSQLRQVKVERKFVFDKLENEFSRILIGIKRTRKQVSLLQEELQLAKAVQYGETKKFFQGDSTLFLVNEREQSTTQVKLNTLHAQIQLEELKAKTRYFTSAELPSPLTQTNK